MQSPLRILHLEDSPKDAELIQARLAGAGIAFKAVTVATEAEYRTALQSGGFDVILCESSLPDFDGLSALKLAQERQPDAPVIIVPGAIGEERAIDALRSGARDCVSKDDLARLAAAVEGAAREAKERAKRREAEGKLKVLGAAVDSAISGMFLAVLDGRITYANKAALAMTGYSEAEAIGLDLLSLAQDRKHAEGILAELRRGRSWAGEIAGRKKDGSELHMNLSGNLVCSADGTPACLMLSFRDITERKRAEAALLASEEKYRGLFESSRDAIMTLEPPSWKFTSGNPATLKMFEAKNQEEFISLGPWQLSPERQPDGRASDEKAKEMIETAMREGSHFFEWTHRRIGGEEFPATVLLSRMRSAEKVFLQGTVRDITESKRREESHRRLATAVEQAAEAIIITDANATILYVNPAFERITGYTREEAIGQNPDRSLEEHLRILKSDKHDAGVYRQVWDTLGRGEVWHGRLVNKRKDGALYEEDVTISPVRDTAGRIVNYIAVKLDVTHEAQLETQLRQAQKMEAVGRLAGGVAHDFNNILSVVLGYGQMVLQKTTSDDPLRKKLEAMVRAAERGAALARQLLIFSRKQVVEPKVISLNLLVTDFDKMLRRLIGEDIKLTLALAPDAGYIRADPGQIEQVIMNLCVNARDAMPKGGGLFIETGNVTLDEAYARVHHGTGLGSHVMLAVSDTGCGMSSEVLSHVFEPFFTTKGPGKGTGLGLPVVYGIVKRFGGSIGVYSEVGHGTTFKVYFPRLDATAQLSGPRAAVLAGKAHGETVLVVDDEEDIRSMVQETLQDLGYKVLAGAGPQDALRLAEAHTGPLHLLVTDVVMPEMSGKELAERVQAKHPEVKVLYMSGYTDSALLGCGVDDETLAFIEKPFMPAALAKKVREVLGAAAETAA